MKALAQRAVEASKVAELAELRQPVTHEEVLRELRRTCAALAALQGRLEALPQESRSGGSA